MLLQRFKPNRQARNFLLLAVLIFLLLRGFLFLERNIRPTVWALAKVKAEALAVHAINTAVLEKVAQQVNYQDLIQITKDKDGRIVFAQVNNIKVNSICAETTLEAQKALNALEKEKIAIPLGQIFDSYVFAHLGPKIPVQLTPVGYVNTHIVDRFENAGINQVRHKIYLQVQAVVRIGIPLLSDVTEIVTTIPIVDAIYPGKVPETVINLDFANGT